MHRRHGYLRSHIEPDTGGHCHITVPRNFVRVDQEFHLAVVGAWVGEHIGELAVVVVP